MKSLLAALWLALGVTTALAANPTPLTMQIDRSANSGAGPFPICANVLSSAAGCQSIGTMGPGGFVVGGSGAALTGITPGQVGAVNKSGDTMTGPLFGVGSNAFAAPAQSVYPGDGFGMSVQYGPNTSSTGSPGGAPEFDAYRAMVTNGTGNPTTGVGAGVNGINGSTGQVTAIAGVIRGLVSNHGYSGGNNGFSVAGFYNATAEVNGAVAWSVNTTVADMGPDRSASAIANNDGSRVVEGAEMDFNIWNRNTVTLGINMFLNTQGTTAVGNQFGFITAKNTLSQPWNTSYTSGNGAAVTALNAGTASQAAVANDPSQPVTWSWRGGDAVQRTAALAVATNVPGIGNVLSLTGAGTTGFYGANYAMPSGGQFLIGNGGAGTTPISAMSSDSSNNLYIGGSAQTTQMQSNVLPQTAGGQSLGSTAKPFGNVVAVTLQASLSTPASSTAACTAGQFTNDASYHYVCVATNTWKRVALTAF